MAIETIDLTGSLPPSPARSQQRKRKAASGGKAARKVEPSKAIDLTQDDWEAVDVAKPKKRKQKASEEFATEKRLKKYRESAPSAIRAIYERALSQRMFCLDRQRGGDENCPTETLKVAGSTGNVYEVKIDKIPSCDCPYARKGNECKHVLFALVKVLRASNYWQRAYLSSELREIFDKAPAIVPVDAEKTDNKRKPIDEDDTCPICFMEFENGHEDTVYCKAACGNNIHKECFDHWAASRRRSAAPVTCPFCRSNFYGDSKSDTVDMEIVTQRGVNAEGYHNVAEEVGVSTQRDYNSYNPFWVRQQARRGVDVGDYADLYPTRGGR